MLDRLALDQGRIKGMADGVLPTGTRHTSAALHTLGREHLAFSMMRSAMSRSASLST